jgi:hypothetical protein
MLTLFSDCTELSDSTDDGWTVMGPLVKAYVKEKAPISEICVN